MDNKLQLKKMSHKKLRKLCKQFGKEVTELSITLSNLKGEFTTVKQREISWKQQLDAEVYYKNQAINKSKELSIQLTKLEDTHGDLKQHARSLEKLLASTARNKDKRIEELEHALDALGYKPSSESTKYIGEMPEELVMGVDGQLSEKPAKVDEAVEWAKRNGHHFPNGRPDKGRSTDVVVKSADEISVENRANYIEYIESGRTDKM